MDIRLPDLTIQPDWTAESQLTKINEEYLKWWKPSETTTRSMWSGSVGSDADREYPDRDTASEYHLNINKFMVEHLTNYVGKDTWNDNLIIAIWLSLSVGFVAGAVWTGICKVNERLDAPE